MSCDILLALTTAPVTTDTFSRSNAAPNHIRSDASSLPSDRRSYTTGWTDMTRHTSPPAMTPRRAATAALLGSALEYYDFFIYGAAAALVFNVLFFPSGDPTVALIASLATFAVGYVARPIGAVVMGHFGDRVGRKRVMLITVVMMGAASFAIGCLPTFDSIGVLAPTLLVALRVVQGFSAGAESAGASTLTVEHSPAGRRGFFSSFVMVGYAIGSSMATVVFLPVALLPEDMLYSWGWRIPFWLSAVVVVVTYYVRSHLDETPIFVEAKEESQVRKRPLSDVFTYHWREVVRVAGATLMASIQTLFSVFSWRRDRPTGVCSKRRSPVDRREHVAAP